MANKIVGDIAVQVGADIAPLQRKMGLAGKSVKKFGNDFEAESGRMARAAASVSGALAGMVTVGALASIGKGVDHTLKFAKALENLSRIAGTDVENFQRMTYAAGQFGIEQEKLADILKDVNDKVGDFMQTGGGPLKDFFENIAPKVGVTADQFKNLSGPDALQLYVSSLEKAGLSSADLTFYMEALASDATALIPLLADNGAEMDRLGKSAEALGIVINDDLITKTARMNEVWDAALSQMHTRFIYFAATTMQGFDAIFGVTEASQVNILRKNLDDLSSEYSDTADTIAEEKERMNRVSSQFPTAPKAAGNLSSLEMAAQSIKEEMNIVNSEIAALGELEAKREAARQRIEDLRNGTGPDGKPIDTDTNGKGGGKSGPSQDDLDRMMEMFATESELIDQNYIDNLAKLREFRDAKLLTEQEYNEAEQQLKSQHEAQIAGLEAQARASRMSAILGAGAEVLGALGANNAKAFKMAQAFTAGVALMDAWGAYNKVLNDPTPQPWWVRLSAAATVLASGIRTVASIKSATQGGGGSSAGASAAPSAVASQSQAPLEVRMTGLGANDIISGSMLGGLLDRLSDEAGDRGYKLMVAQ